LETYNVRNAEKTPKMDRCQELRVSATKNSLKNWTNLMIRKQIVMVSMVSHPFSYLKGEKEFV